MEKLFIGLTLLLFISCEETTTVEAPDVGREAEVEITNFEMRDQPNSPNVLYQYSISQFDTNEPLDPVVLFFNWHCDCEPEVWDNGSMVMDNHSGEGGYGATTPPDEATEVWVELSWIDDLGEHSIESDHVAIN